MPNHRMAERSRFRRLRQPCGIIQATALWPLCRYRHNGHWTKHENRLARDFGRVRFGDEGYAREELVAELGSAFLAADLELTPEVREDHAAYIGSWLKALRDDKRLIFSAATHAQRAVDYLHGLQSQAAIEAGSASAEEQAA
jgi:antirestriction protein ArdC